MKPNTAPVIQLKEFAKIRKNLGTIVATSGGYDPVHPGHLSCLLESAVYGDTLVVIVNGDDFLRHKKGQAFMDLKTRCEIVSYIRNVDFVIPFETQKDDTVREALRIIRPHIFTKGGDRKDKSNIPEWDICNELGIKICLNVGHKKEWSSTNYLEDWGRFWSDKKNVCNPH